jgi:hypothetical protein
MRLVSRSTAGVLPDGAAQGFVRIAGSGELSFSTLNMSAFGGKADISDRLADVR